MKLSTIIVNWNTKELLAQCLESIYGVQIEGGQEIFVVDNASTDGSSDMVAEKFPNLKLLKNEFNLGFASGNNRAIQASQGDYVLLLNSDTRVLNDALEQMIQFMDGEPRSGGCGARLLNPDGSLQLSCSPEPTLKSEFLRLFRIGNVRPDGYYSMADWDVKAPRQADVVLGACLLIRRTALDQIGLLDEDYYMYSEEVDYCYRLRKAGWNIYWVPQAQVVHYGGQSTRQAATKMFLYLYEGKIKYFRKHFGWLAAFFYKIILFAAGLVRLITASCLWLVSSTKRETYQNLAGNYTRLLLALPAL